MAAVTSCQNTLYKVQEKVTGSRRLENGLVFHWILPGARTTSQAIATNFEEEIIRLKNLCTRSFERGAYWKEGAKSNHYGFGGHLDV